jgi:hypothetical protein
MYLRNSQAAVTEKLAERLGAKKWESPAGIFLPQSACPFLFLTPAAECGGGASSKLSPRG